MTETQATSRPWKRGGARQLDIMGISAEYPHKGELSLARTGTLALSEDEMQANAALIVRAVNNHGALVEALERALPVVVEAHKMTHSQGTPAENCHRCEQIAADRATLNVAKEA